MKTFILILSFLTAFAGEPDSPAAPDDSASAMYTLDAIYFQLLDGTPGVKRGTGFAEPSMLPGTGTMHSLDDVMAVAPESDDATGATPNDVAQGKTFWGLHSESWGPQTGEALCVTCEGTIWDDPATPEPETRWCDNGDGTITDMTTGLVWLQNASWGGRKKWRCSDSDPDRYDDAHARVGTLHAGATGANLSDGSVEGDWRLPTKSELVGLTTGDEAVSSDSPRVFSGVQAPAYWTSTTDASNTINAWFVRGDGYVSSFSKSFDFYLWPVRRGD